MSNRGTTPSFDEEQAAKFGFWGHLNDAGRRLRADIRRSDKRIMLRSLITKYRGALRCWGHENESLTNASKEGPTAGHILTFLDRAEELLEMYHDDAAEYLIKFIVGELYELKLLNPPYSD